jgi:putative hemolysin
MNELVQAALVIFALILLNSYFAALEMALVTSKKSRLRALEKDGQQDAKLILLVKESLGDYLATVQVGISLVASLASAFGGASSVPIISAAIKGIPGLEQYSDQIALLLVVLFITYFSLVIGELVPKQLALQNPERLSMRLIKPVLWLSTIAKLPIRILSISSDFVLRFVSPGSGSAPSTSSEEVEALLAIGSLEGVFNRSESDFVRGVFDYGDRRAKDVMTSRRDLDALDVNTGLKDALSIAAQSGFSRFPIYEDSLDNILGYVHLKDLIWAEKSAALRDLARTILFIPAMASLPDIYFQLTQSRSHQAIVLDEHGGTAGMLTLEDVLEVIVGEIDDEYTGTITPIEIRQLGPQSWLARGSVLIEDLNEYLETDIPATGVYSTAAGLVLAELGRIPIVGDSINHRGFSFTIRQMDKLRIENILIRSN